MPLPRIAYTESSLPGSRREAIRLAQRHGLALEVEDWGTMDFAFYEQTGLTITTVQACRLKHDPPTAPGRRERRRAIDHIEHAIENADRLGARQILTIAAYGRTVADHAFDRALDAFDRAARRGRELGVRILVEPLSPRRSPVFHEPQVVIELLRTLDQPESFGLALDTGHLLDGELDPVEVIRDIDTPISELQLRGADSTPPEPEPATEWVNTALSTLAPEGIFAVEHREPTTPEDCGNLIAALRETLG